MLIDTHSHLDFKQFDEDRDEVIRRAQQNGVSLIINVGINPDTSKQCVAIASRYDHIYASAGIHPHDAEMATPNGLRKIEGLAIEPKVVAIGEVGLDYHYDQPSVAVQQNAFRQQIRMARRLGKPLIIHSREANADVLRILQEEGAGEVGGVMHCYSGTLEETEAFISMGFLISIAGPVTFRNAGSLREVASGVDLKNLLLETDCPFLAPHPHRGKRNEPAHVALIAREVAAIKGVPVSEVAKETTLNAKRLFRIG